MDMTLTFAVNDVETTRMSSAPMATGLDFLQMRGRYEVSGRLGDRAIAFTAPGAAETFRGSRP
jgi:hypothetical protein